MKLSKVIGGIAVVALVAIGAFTLSRPHATAPVAQDSTQQAGSVSGPDLYSPYFNVNGVYRWFYKQALTRATTTPCAIKSPAATSTLFFADVNITTATTTATTWSNAFATTPYATTTLNATAFSVASGAQGALIVNATSTPIAPNTWVVWGMAGSAVGPLLQGSCQAIFQQV